jgi:dienelactone hydrolase
MEILMRVLILLSMICSASIIQGESIDYELNGKVYEGYYVSPAEEGAPLVVLLHDWDGLTDYEIKRSDMLVEQGYAVFAADLFGKGIRPDKVVDRRQHTGELYEDREKMRQLIQAAVEMAEENGADVGNMVVMGYCFGGAAVLEYARSGADAKGFASFHGGLATPEGQDYAKTKAPVVVYHGSADTAITLQEFATLAKELESHGVPHEMITYGGAPHAFTVFESDRYVESADQKSWAQFLAFLREMLLS